MRRSLSLGLVFAFVASHSSWALANPNAADPASAFDVLLKETSGPLVAEGAALYAQIIAANRRDVAAVDAGKREQLKPADLAATTVAVRQLNRIATRLMQAGETAGNDFFRRAYEETEINNRMISASNGLNPALKYDQTSRATIGRSTEPRARELKQIEELMKKGQWDQAEVRIYKQVDALIGLAIYIPSESERASIFNPSAALQTTIDGELIQIRRQATEQQLIALRDSQNPNYDAALQEVDAAAKSVAAGGSATLDGQSLDGPTLVARYAEKWKEIQTAALRSRAAHWTLVNNSQSGGNSGASIDATKAPPSEAGYAAFAKSMAAALLQIVEADAGRVGVPEVESLHRAYLTALAPLVNQVADPAFPAAGQTALDHLAAKSPETAARATAYRAATDEVLRWRRRVAEGEARRRSADYATAGALLIPAAKAQGTFAGLYQEQNPDVLQPQLYASGPAVVNWSRDKLLEKPVLVPAVSAMANGKSGVSRYVERSYCTLALAPLPEQVAALERDLLANASSPPLSLAAAAALDSARRGDLVSAGGTIRGYHLESVLARWGTLPQPAWVLAPLGVLPAEKATSGLAPNVLVRFDVAPRWVRHEYFFAELPAP